jgi:hypothetical protein
MSRLLAYICHSAKTPRLGGDRSRQRGWRWPLAGRGRRPLGSAVASRRKKGAGRCSLVAPLDHAPARPRRRAYGFLFLYVQFVRVWSNVLVAS